jgi:ribosomal protein S18 acetylase RimI-like enzyme
MSNVLIESLQSQHLGDAMQLIYSVDSVALPPWENDITVYRRFLLKNPLLSTVATIPVDPETDQRQRKVVGCVLLGDTGLRGMLHHLIVHPDFTGQRIATKLVRRSLMNLYSFTPTRRVVLGVLAENHPGNGFWRSVPNCIGLSSDGGKVALYSIDMESHPETWAWNLGQETA